MRPDLRPDACRNVAWQPEGFKRRQKKKRRHKKSGRACISESVRSAILTITVPLATNPSPPSSSGSTTPLTTCAGPTSPSFRVLTERRRGSGLRKRPASKATPEPAEVEESSDEDDTEDHSYERRHQPFEQLERLGYELRASAFELMARRVISLIVTFVNHTEFPVSGSGARPRRRPETTSCARPRQRTMALLPPLRRVRGAKVPLSATAQGWLPRPSRSCPPRRPSAASR